LLQACIFFPSTPAAPIAEAETNVPAYDEDTPELPPAVAPQIPGRFTLRFDPNSSVNPLTTLNRDSIVLSSLLYESLFVLDSALMPHPQLVESWYSEDNMLFEFVIRSDIAMHDDTTLTAQDVAYSIRQAARTGRFASRFENIRSIDVTGDLTVSIEIRSPNSRFINLLDVPIIKSGSSGSRLPPGSGPFRFPHDEAMHLVAFSMHRDFADLPLDLIHLRECADTELTELFDTGELSLIWDDPAGAFDIRLNRLRETRYFETTSLQFIGFNANHVALRNPDIRRAISASIDRDYIVENIKPPGMTLASPLALSPAFPFYDPVWAYQHLPPLEQMARLLQRAGLDISQNGYVDNPFPGIITGVNEFGEVTSTIEFTIDFIVNIENTHKVAAAHQIAERLRRNGLNVIVRELPWERFLTALRTENFGMFYGETQLGADFDLSPLLLPGPLNFGRTASNNYAPFLTDFLLARTEHEIRWASERLVDEIRLNAPFAPILYKRHAIYTPIGAIVRAEPSQSAVFRNISDWTINLMMLD